MRKYVLDTNCYIDASRNPDFLDDLSRFSAWSTPGLYLSSVVASELRAGTRSGQDRKKLEEKVLGPFVRRGRVLTPTAAGWDALGLTLSTLREVEGLVLSEIRRSFALDILLAFSCRQAGVALVAATARDMERIRTVFSFDYVKPFPERV